MSPDAEMMKRLRRISVELLYARHSQQKQRFDDVGLWHAMRGLGADLGQNDMLTTLQDIQERGYVSFASRKDTATNRMIITQIQITPRGRDLVEGTILDPAVPV